MIAWFRSLLDGIHGVREELSGLRSDLSALLEALGASPAGLEGVEDRLEDLERSRALWEAEVEGVLLQAENKFKAARSSEERTRRLAESAEFDEDGLDELPERIQELYRRDEAGGPEEGVQPVPEGMEPPPSPQEWAVRAKAGV